MANNRKPMENIREMLRMHEAGFSRRKIARTLKISRPTIGEYLTQFEEARVDYAACARMSDDQLLEIFRKDTKQQEKLTSLVAKFEEYVKELKRTGVTLKLLWQEYIAENPAGYRYSQFNHHFSQWKKDSAVAMHMEHKVGDKMFVDYAGKKMSWVDLITGEVHEVEVFVSILGASQLTFALATESQKKTDWIKANEKALRFFGGVCRAIVPDCLKSAVSKADRYEPAINPDYADFAEHYGTVILPARPGHPQDKSLVEGAVKLVYQRVFAPLRNEVFHSLEELNRAILEKVEEHNNRVMHKMKISRRDLFEDIERAELLPLPRDSYEFKKFQKAKAHINYHVLLKEDEHYYSVPHRYRGREIRVIYTDSVVSLYFNNTRIAIHKRDRRKHRYTTLPEHMPSNHRYIAEWSPERFLNMAEKRGEFVRELVSKILESRKHPEQAFKSCQGVIHLADKFGEKRLNRACKRALNIQDYSYGRLKEILENGMDKLEEEQPPLPLPRHENIRGEEYYAMGGIQ